MEPMKRLTIIYGAPQEIYKNKNKKKHIVTNGNVHKTLYPFYPISNANKRPQNALPFLPH